MCVYCVTGDSWFRHDRPFEPDRHRWPTIPHPVGTPPAPWSIEKLKEYLEVLKEIKALEDKLGCPCEPNKADYVAVLEERIAFLKKQAKKR